jgi:hypothetical protein
MHFHWLGNYLQGHFKKLYSPYNDLNCLYQLSLVHILNCLFLISYLIVENIISNALFISIYEITSHRTSKVLDTHKHWPHLIKIIPQLVKMNTCINDHFSRQYAHFYNLYLFSEKKKMEIRNVLTVKFKINAGICTLICFDNLHAFFPASPAYGVNISQLIRYARACSTYDQFFSSRQSIDR